MGQVLKSHCDFKKFHGPWGRQGDKATSQCYSARILAAGQRGEEKLGDDGPATCLSPWVGFPYTESLGTGDPLGGSTCEDPN